MKELPLEIWFTIMNDHINSLKQLGECRLVCRAWDRIAESTVLGKELVINATNATKFYNYLSSKSSKGNLIKHLVFNDQFDINQQRMDIVQLGFTPTIQSLTGFLGNEEFIKLLIDKVHASPVKFNNMKTIISWLSQEDNFFELASLFKDTLQELSLELCVCSLPLEPNETILLLDEFKQLKCLDLDLWLTPAFCDWDNLLQKCHHLTSLKIEMQY